MIKFLSEPDLLNNKNKTASDKKSWHHTDVSLSGILFIFVINIIRKAIKYEKQPQNTIAFQVAILKCIHN